MNILLFMSVSVEFLCMTYHFFTLVPNKVKYPPLFIPTIYTYRPQAWCHRYLDDILLFQYFIRVCISVCMELVHRRLGTVYHIHRNRLLFTQHATPEIPDTPLEFALA